MSVSYQTDFYACAMEQAALFRAGRLSSADVDNIAKEVESMGERKGEPLDRLAVLCFIS